MKKLAVLGLALAVVIAFAAPMALQADCGSCGGDHPKATADAKCGGMAKGDWDKKGDWGDWGKGKHGKKGWGKMGHVRPMKIVGGALGLAFLIAIISGLLVLLRAVAPGYVGKLNKSISKHTVRNLVVGLVAGGALAAGCYYVCGSCGGPGSCAMAGGSSCSPLGMVLCAVGILLMIGVTFAGAALSEIVGAKVLALSGAKNASTVKSIAVGVAVVTLAICAICPTNHVGPGSVVLVAVLAIELGAALSVLFKRG